MLREEAKKAVARLYARFANPKMATGGFLDEWIALAMEYRDDDWDAASRDHIRSTAFGSPNIAEMTDCLRRARSDRKIREAEAARPAFVDEAGCETHWKAICERDAQRAEAWCLEQPDETLDDLRDDLCRGVARSLFLADGQLIGADEIRRRRFVCCLVYAHFVNLTNGAPALAGVNG